MSQAGFTPISIYYSATASAVPLAANLVAGELALNTLDGKLYYKNSSNVVTLLASNAATTNVSSITFGTTGLTPSTVTTGAVTVAGTLATANGGTNLTSFTSGGAVYATSTSALTTGTLPTASGGTALTSFTSGGAVYATSTSALTTGTLPVASGGSGAVTLTGVLKGNGTSAFTDATAGTDYVAPGTATTFTALQTFAGTSSNADMKTSNILETDTISATAATGTINYDVTTQSVLYYTSNASGNWTLNFRGSSGTTLNAVMSTGESLSATFLVTNGSTAYYNSAVTIDGTSVTPKWQGGFAPTSGNASSTDCYSYVIQKTGSATYVVLASQTKFA